MKRFILFFVALTFSGFMFGQNVVIQANATGSTSEAKDDCAYRIAGICTTEDAGGVEISKDCLYASNYAFLVFENYNSFAVSVIFEYVEYGNKKTGTIILKANEKKKTTDTYYIPSDFKLIARKLNNISTVSNKVITLMGYLLVCPEDLGEFSEYPADIIQNLNQNKAFGVGNWRLPTDAELNILKQNYQKIDLKYNMNGGARDFYYASEKNKLNGDWTGGYKVRLVATAE